MLGHFARFSLCAQSFKTTTMFFETTVSSLWDVWGLIVCAAGGAGVSRKDEASWCRQRWPGHGMLEGEGVGGLCYTGSP